ncbi:MAG: hypothetical protein ABL929_07915 [Ferruginibacter sp.]
MKRYLITNARYEGEVVLVYNTDGILQKIDFANTNMTVAAIAKFKDYIPAQECDLKKAFSSETIIVKNDFVILFETFWQKYNHKFNKDRCEKLWQKMSNADKVLAYFGLDKYHRFLRKNVGHLKLHPDTYLRNRAWENDYK